MKNKLGIIASGGGMLCAYTAGVSLALADLGITKPDVVICSSGSAGTFAYWVAEQYDSIRNIWENLATTREFISYWRLNKIMDIDYMIDVVFKKLDPLLISSLKNSTTNLLVGVTNCNSGVGQYFSNHDDVDFLEVLRASMAMPIAYNRSVTIRDINYADGDIALTSESKIKEAKNIGVNKLIVIESTGSTINRVALQMYSLFINRSLRLSLLKSINSKSVETSSDIIVITPRKNLPASTLTSSRQDITNTIDIGYDDALKSNLNEFVKLT